MRHRGRLTWGVILAVVWAAITIPATLAYSEDPVERLGMAIALQLFIGFMAILSVVFLVTGILGEIRAKRFNAQDWALAHALAESLRELWSQPSETAYQVSDNEFRIQGARLIEIERHFDSQTNGAILGSMTHQLRMFGTSFSTSYGQVRGTHASSTSLGNFSGSIRGLSEVNLDLSTTTRNNLLGDALFSVFEAPGPAGERDTYRVISMSQPGAAGWINDLVQFAAHQFEGPMTHAGTAVLNWGHDLTARFVPGDISYVTDRLKALHSRPAEERELVTVRGTPAGRNAFIATSLSIGEGEELKLMPALFPGLLGHAVAVAMANGEHQLSHRLQPSLPQS
jgi:hypothetical protein